MPCAGLMLRARPAVLASCSLGKVRTPHICIKCLNLRGISTSTTFRRSVCSSAKMASNPVKRVAEDLETPALDDRSYRVIQLPNKLEALLVHDTETDKASASVSVDVGSLSDADDMPGMAHAVEHLLFMGTKKVSLQCLLLFHG